MNRKTRRSQKTNRRGGGNKSQHSPQARFEKAVEYFQAGRFREARKLAERLTDEYPKTPDLYLLRGTIALHEGQYGQAEDVLRRGLFHSPDNAALADLLGTALVYQRKFEEAITACRRAVANAPNDGSVVANLGNALMLAGDFPSAVETFRESLRIRPGDAKTEGNLGGALKKLDRLEEAEIAHRRSIEIDPTELETYIDLGDLLVKKQDWPAVIVCLDEAIRKGTENPDAFVFKSKALATLGRLDEAEETIEKALEINPNHAYARMTASLYYLYAERWLDSWRAFEARWEMPATPPRPFPQPLWCGQECAGKTVLAWGEQGLGDEVMYASMLPDLLGVAGKVVLETDPRLVPLFRRSFPEIQCLPRRTPPVPETQRPDIDYQVPLGNLGTQFRKTEEEFPGGKPYLEADSARVEMMRERYASEGTLLIGIAWSSKRADAASQKSMSLNQLSPLFELPGIRFVDLQYGDTQSERDEFEAETGFSLVHDAEIDQMVDVDAFAAQVAAMDLIISISNTTVHMAGALGVPTWLMIHAVPGRRWMLRRTDSPWYDCIRIFRQTELGAWGPVVADVRRDLAAFAAARSGQQPT